MSNDSRFGRRKALGPARSSQTPAHSNRVAGESRNYDLPDGIALPEETSQATALLYAGTGAALLFSMVLFVLVGLPMLSRSLTSAVPAQVTSAEARSLLTPPEVTGSAAAASNSDVASAPDASGEPYGNADSGPAPAQLPR